MSINKDPTTPPPFIGKIGPYTVFMTPPPTPKSPHTDFDSPTPLKTPSPTPHLQSPRPVVSQPLPPRVQPPPQQFDKSTTAANSGSVSGFFRNAVVKVQNAHSSLDDHVARWFGLNQSKYQWALDDYYENKGIEKEGLKANEKSDKMQSV